MIGIRVKLGNKTLFLIGQRTTDLGLDSADAKACEKIFELTNAGSPKNAREWIRGGCPSMSIGDAVWFSSNRETWLCDASGFTKLTKGQVEIFKNLHPIDRSINVWQAIKAGGNMPSLAAHRAEYDLYENRKAGRDPGNQAEADLVNSEMRLQRFIDHGVKVV